VVAEHMALHQALIDAVGSPRLARLYGSLAAETRLPPLPPPPPPPR